MRRLLVLALVMLGSACTATPSASDDTDQPRMSAVERSASERGVKVYWVNPPRKPAATPSGG